MPSDPFQLIGRTLGGKYRVDRVVGEGGYGVVYAGQHLSLGEPIAIKCFKTGAGGGASAEAHEAFLREARVLFTLTHPGIVRMYDVDQIETPSGSVPYVVLEFVNGVPLEQEIERRARGQGAPFSSAEILAIFEPILDALSFAHGKGIAHRDLKPSNVMLSRGPNGELSAKLLDFGTARVNSRVTQIGVTSGLGFTPRYASPEQWDPSYGTTGPASDVFSLGLMLGEVCTLHPVLQGATPQEILRETMNPHRLTLVSARRYDLPSEVDQVVARATRVSPPERFASTRELLDALRRALGGARDYTSLTLPAMGRASVPQSPSGVWPYVVHPAPAARTPSPLIGLWVVLIVLFGMVAGCLACVGTLIRR